ncbi:aldehyde dehydrogenase family protein [Pseudarthrobacter oxydans]|uniref:aldehyde dehydrogenase family protein n=1 Tax=Pseudarthrobacter oxydans TaxID=1671 RepID=UPI003D2AEF02
MPNENIAADLIASVTTPVDVPHVIAGAPRREGTEFLRENPSHPTQVVSKAYAATQELVQEAVDASRAAQRAWSRVPVSERAAKVRAGIDYVNGNVDAWALRAALETGKPWNDAKVEALETLQFLEIYPSYVTEEGYFEDPRQQDGDDHYTSGAVLNASVLRPYGVFGVITPFNYPGALASGPAIAAVLAGNGVVIKTSSLAPWTGLAVYEMFEAMDLPAGLVNVIHGGGKELVATDVDGIAFTGSAETGKLIAQTINDGPYPRPFIAEMGGKNPLIVTDTANLEQAADAIIYSAFHLTGQKCSALSRVLVDAGSHEKLVELLSARINTFTLGAPEQDADLGPVINEGAVRKYKEILQQAKAEGFAYWQARNGATEGYFVSPLLIAGVPANHPLAREEHFLPVVTISPVEGFEQAITEANASEYGLTAGIFTGEAAEAEEFLHLIEAGCVNVNIDGHATSGWWPGPQTFGGWKGSGSTGIQGFGKWYVQQFMRQQARKVPQNLRELLSKV